MAAIARKIRAYGRVQGVFFRQWTLEQACKLGVAGWVHNRADGSIEAHLEGDETAVAQLTEHMRRGPSRAQVDDLTIEEAAPEGRKDFSVKL